MEFNEFHEEERREARTPDPVEERAREKIEKFFEENRERVFYSRQIEIQNEDEFFHWVTNRAIREIEATGLVRSEFRPLKNGGSIKLIWHNSYRYYRRAAIDVVKLVEEYADPNIGGALGNHGELMVLEGFAKNEFVLKGRNTREFKGKKWSATEHDLDFIFERDARAYGVEVKNMLGYMEHEELKAKISLCKELGIKPVFVVRMMPKIWIQEVAEAGGFVLILKYQLYPLSHKSLARRVAEEFKIPVAAPSSLYDATMARFVKWHVLQL